MESNNQLFRLSSEEYGEAYQHDYLAMYQHYIDSADKISDRRHQANSLFLSINTILLAVSSDSLAGTHAPYLWVSALAGILFCYSWRLLIRQYRSLNTAKFQVVHEMEKRLPMAPYDAEWQMLGEGKDPKIHLPLSKVESMVPVIFICLHCLVLIISTSQAVTNL